MKRFYFKKSSLWLAAMALVIAGFSTLLAQEPKKFLKVHCQNCEIKFSKAGAEKKEEPAPVAQLSPFQIDFGVLPGLVGLGEEVRFRTLLSGGIWLNLGQSWGLLISGGAGGGWSLVTHPNKAVFYGGGVGLGVWPGEKFRLSLSAHWVGSRDSNNRLQTTGVSGVPRIDYILSGRKAGGLMFSLSGELGSGWDMPGELYFQYGFSGGLGWLF